MSSQSRRPLGRDRNKVLTPRDTSGRLGLEGERTRDEGTENSSQTFVLPLYEDCELCWARFENGVLQAACKCVMTQVDDAG